MGMNGKFNGKRKCILTHIGIGIFAPKGDKKSHYLNVILFLISIARCMFQCFNHNKFVLSFINV